MSIGYWWRRFFGKPVETATRPSLFASARVRGRAILQVRRPFYEGDPPGPVRVNHLELIPEEIEFIVQSSKPVSREVLKIIAWHRLQELAPRLGGWGQHMILDFQPSHVRLVQ